MLYGKINYTADINYLTNTFIREYDISKANINILYSKGMINKETYDYLYNSERMIRQVYIGRLQKKTKYADALKAGIIEAKKMLFESNMIKDYEVLSIKNDAVYIIGRQLPITDFGLIKFANKNQYTSYFKIHNLEIYYYFNAITKEEKIDVKGINDDKLKLHENFMLSFIKDVFYILQVSTTSNAINMVRDFYNEYITYQLPVEYYRMFNNSSNFHYKASPFINTGFESITVSEKDKTSLDISNNLSIITEIQKILISMTFK